MVELLQNVSLTATNTFGFEGEAGRYSEVSDVSEITSLFA